MRVCSVHGSREKRLIYGGKRYLFRHSLMHEMKNKERESVGGVEEKTKGDYVVSIRVEALSLLTCASGLLLFSTWTCFVEFDDDDDWGPATPTTRSRCNQSSARSMVSENTAETDRNISRDSSPNVSSLIEVSCTRPGACGPSAGELAGDTVVDVLRVAHLPGSASINRRTLAFACSGKPVPAYLLTTSTTLRRVSMISFLIAVSVEFAVEGVATALDWLPLLLDPTASETRKLRSSCICCSICLVAY